MICQWPRLLGYFSMQTTFFPATNLNFLNYLYISNDSEEDQEGFWVWKKRLGFCWSPSLYLGREWVKRELWFQGLTWCFWVKTVTTMTSYPGMGLRRRPMYIYQWPDTSKMGFRHVSRFEGLYLSQLSGEETRATDSSIFLLRSQLFFSFFFFLLPLASTIRN